MRKNLKEYLQSQVTLADRAVETLSRMLKSDPASALRHYAVGTLVAITHGELAKSLLDGEVDSCVAAAKNFTSYVANEVGRIARRGYAGNSNPLVPADEASKLEFWANLAQFLERDEEFQATLKGAAPA